MTFAFHRVLGTEQGRVSPALLDYTKQGQYIYLKKKNESRNLPKITLACSSEMNASQINGAPCPTVSSLFCFNERHRNPTPVNWVEIFSFVCHVSFNATLYTHARRGVAINNHPTTRAQCLYYYRVPVAHESRCK